MFSKFKIIIELLRESPMWQNPYSRRGFITSQVCFLMATLISISNLWDGLFSDILFFGGGFVVLACGVYMFRVIGHLQQDIQDQKDRVD